MLSSFYHIIGLGRLYVAQWGKKGAIFGGGLKKVFLDSSPGLRVAGSWDLHSHRQS